MLDLVFSVDQEENYSMPIETLEPDLAFSGEGLEIDISFFTYPVETI